MMLNASPFVHIDWANHFLNKIDLTSYKKILEVGCRQGEISAQLAQSYSQQKFTAIDNEESALERAKNFHYSLGSAVFNIKRSKNHNLGGFLIL